MAKKKLLFVIESLACAGAEKSLTTLLNLLDYSKYDVDLQLFSFGGEFEALVPKEVTVLDALPFFEYCKESIRKNLSTVFKAKNRLYFAARTGYSAKLRKDNYNNIQKSVLFWTYAKKCFEYSNKEYDIAIAYAQGGPTFYVADCIKAKRKYAWVNVTYKPEGKYLDYIKGYYKQYTGIVCVSDRTYEQFTELFSESKDKTRVIYDINDGNFIQKMSKLSSTAEDDMKTDKKIKILTVGRLANQKGYDIATEACRILKSRGISFCWFVLGKGPMEQEIRSWIEEKKIEDCFQLMGVQANPYPYFVNCDLYVQTSRFEGFGITLAEARMLNCPIVTTAFDAVYAQMVQEKNGLVVDMNAKAVADGIQRMIEDTDLRNRIISYLKKEKKGNKEELRKVNALFEEKE